MKHYVICSLIALFALIVPNKVYATMRNVSKVEAYGIIQSQVPSGSNVYYYNTGSVHLFFVDEEPTKGWEHNCKYYRIPIQIDSSVTPTATVEASRYPKYSYNFVKFSISHKDLQPVINVKRSVMTPDQLNAVGNTYAVILSGGIRPTANYQRYWNDCSFIYQILRRRFHIEKDHISVLMSDGTSSGADMVGSTGALISSPLDLDNDGVADINLAATKSNFQAELTRLSQVMTSDDRLFLYVIDHGGTTDYISSSYICLWNGGRMYDYELASLLNNFNVASMNIVLGQCFSGGFIDNLSASNRVITTACTGGQYSYACSNKPYDEFVYQWTSAVNEKDVYGTSVLSDINDDGKVTMSEAFAYAQSNDSQSESPQISSASIKNILALNEVPFTYVLMIRDNDEDVGDEPNTTTENSWISHDIWMRNQDDGMTNQVHETIHVTDFDNAMFYAYYRVKNIGEKAYKGQGMFIHSYWADASMGLSLDVWGGGSNSQNFTNGGPLEAKRIFNTIPAGDSVIVMKQYSVPDGILGRLIDNPSQVYHICYLAFLDPSSATLGVLPPAMATNPNHPDILGKRRVAQNNASFMTLSNTSRMEIPLNVRNIYDNDREFSIEVMPAKEYPTDDSKVEVGIRLSEPLYKSWVESGTASEKMITYKTLPQKVYTQGFNSKLKDIRLAKGETEKIYCTYNILAKEDVKEETVYAYDIALRDKETGELVDGERFVIKQMPRQAILPVIDVEETDRGYLLKATNVNEAANYIWYNSTGEKVGSGQEVNIIPSEKEQKYRLMVEAESDGAINYADITLNSFFAIKSTSPNPFTSQLTITLSTPATDDIEFRLTPVNTVGKAESYRKK